MPYNSPVNYTDGVPVKISEKYKQPPEIKLTTKLTQQLLKRKDPEAFADYNFDLERKIISKTTEWINWRLKEKTERQQRIQQRELMRQKRLEEEQKAKLNQVSYPSDELTSSCDEEEEVDIDNSNEARMKSSNINNQACIPSDKVFSPNFNTILMPTQAVVINHSSDKKSHRRYASNSSNKIDFSFFESDSSPFDNLEMKSMNEMEELAKVLQSTVVEGNQESDDNTLERNNSSESDPSDHQKSISNNNNENDVVNNSDASKSLIPKNDMQLIAATHTNAYGAHNFNPQQLYNNYYGMQSTTINTNQPFYSNQQQQFGIAANQFSPYIVNHQLPNNCYYTQNYAVNHMNYALNNNNMACENNISDSEIKSKSVPDIIKELNDELNNSEKRRTRNISQSTQGSVPAENEKIIAKKNPDDQLHNLPAKTQNLAKQICQMGFKQDLVIRALIRLGDNDKHAVEHLISLNEILQMGFDEEKVSEALIKFDNNKDQALDYLIS
ncbi:ubiquitin-associated protein 1 [Chironomus tepperi]|uniref:ubiquitin-associated protein 1 n=1 Tax=Chironomus tepperi TaxID=113505 RepID=UPI00391FABC2